MKPLTKLKRELAWVEGMLSDIDRAFKSGSDLFLGESIVKFRRLTKSEKDRLKDEIKKLSKHS